ncbi:hypothetical protein [Lentilactobacillus sp. SPB1-3]|uniref:Uncharacterized protein n=1 Tax=Lentilactobacillus terminaliae TaxID=3003483 RepID=A0ACD5DD95_9LACO|nr:hypothetical protein [Lentilactobacillus sp. SPB1-3]MCZ0978074.1 hypothetical protein [Lentilactobacillus sp. SPB1-3]
MTDYDNVRNALKDAIEIAEAKEIKTKIGEDEFRNATKQDIQELIAEPLYSIADLLGMSDLYLENQVDHK